MIGGSREICVPSGRSLVVHSVGADWSRSVILFHATPGSGLIVNEASRAAGELGVSLLCVSRPGYGGSAKAAPGFPVAVEDALAVAGVLGLERFAVIGVSGGGPFAAATAAAAGDRVVAVGIAGGIGLWRDVEPARRSWDPADVRALDLAEAGDVPGAEEVIREQCRAHLGALLAGDDEAIGTSLLPPSETSSEFRSLFVGELRDALTSFDGLVYDNLTLGLPWGWAPSLVRQPAWLWYGDADTVVPVEQGVWYQQQLHDPRLCVRAGEGHGRVIHGHWSEMLQTVTEATARD